jgi:trimethylguanosine synthase
MTVLCNRCDLWDSATHFNPEETYTAPSHHHQSLPVITPYRYVGASSFVNLNSTAVVRVPFSTKVSSSQQQQQQQCVIDTVTPNPHDPSVVHDKYWCQRRRLFSRFDRGIQLDGEGWFSVTPEIIADHVASRIADLSQKQYGITILDAFCGCGGNSIAFGKIPSHRINKVVCVDTDRSKLLKAANNASLYGIPKEKLVFIECNSIFILKYCYKNGIFVLDQPCHKLPNYMPKPVSPTIHAGYRVGGLDLLPRKIDAVFMDPPWGGVDYEVLGKNGYDLEKNMKIREVPEEEEEEDADDDGFDDDFFDSFSTPSKKSSNNKFSQKARKANFNKKEGHESDYVDGKEMLRVAAEATSTKIVVYDLPRNTNKNSLAKCALHAGYRGNVKLEEHYLNGRLKTVTAYMGVDYSQLVEQPSTKETTTTATTSQG